MATSMVLDAHRTSDLDPPTRRNVMDLKDVVHHTDRGSQYTSIRFTERLAEAGIQPSVGAVGSSYDNALAETINGLYKTELIRPRKPWRTIEEVELATAEWVDWFNHRRLYEYCGDIPPVDLEAAYYAQHPETSRRLSSHTRKSPDSPGRFIGTRTMRLGSVVVLCFRCCVVE
jgi:putative transposase